MIRRALATTCTLLAITWAGLGVAWYPSTAPELASAHHVTPVRAVAAVGISSLCAMAAFAFRRERRWPGPTSRSE